MTCGAQRAEPGHEEILPLWKLQPLLLVGLDADASQRAEELGFIDGETASQKAWAW